MIDSHVYLGLRSAVVCIDARTGETVWSKDLSTGFGDGFVSMALAEKVVFAHTRGKLYCLDRLTGSLQWENQLEGMGFGTAFICCDSTPMSGGSLLKKESMRSSGT